MTRGQLACHGARMERRLGFSLRAYRKQRRWQVDSLEDGYVKRLPKSAKDWLEGFLREYYACDAKRVREGLHADRLTVAQVKALPARLRRWWGRQRELWPALATAAGMRAIGLNPDNKADRAKLDTSRRRELYVDQNRTTRDVYSLGRVVYSDDREDDE